MTTAYIILALIVAFFAFIIYLLIDFAMIKGGANQFWDKWVKKTLWIWLPFYGLQRLIREVILKKK